MKFVALVSGGKDSFYSIMESIRNGHELIACAHLSPRQQEPDEDEESYMYQTAASECISIQVEECLGMPLIIRQCVGRSANTSLVYDHVENMNEDQDEVEDLFELLSQVKERYPNVQGVSTGAILSTYQRTRIESVCGRLGLTPLSYLWRMGPQSSLLESMLKDGIEAVLVKVASPPGLSPRKHLNKTLGALYYGGVFGKLKERFDFHICGEGGEYETLVLDCPIFKKKLVLSHVEIIESDDGVGILKIHKCCAIDKNEQSFRWNTSGPLLYERIQSDHSPTPHDIIRSDRSDVPIIDTAQALPVFAVLPHVKVMPGGLAHVSEILSQHVPRSSNKSSSCDIEAELAVSEAKSIFFTLQETLKSIQWTSQDQIGHCAATAKDVVFVHLYLSNISHFKEINTHYSNFFGTILPPSRSCVSVGRNVLPGGRRVMMDCMIQRGSGDYMRISSDSNLDVSNKMSPVNAQFVMDHVRNPHHQLRSTLHVQSISHWAPVCVGPYSQANTLRSSLIFMAGQIGLRPETMTLISEDWKQQLRQSWKNASSVLDALRGSLKNAMGAVIYLASKEILEPNGNLRSNNVWNICENICRESIKSNGGIEAGLVEELNVSHSDELNGGYEDYETYKEIMASQNIDVESIHNQQAHVQVPFLMVAIPEMPVGAVSEVELICATERASSCLEMKLSCSWDEDPSSSVTRTRDEEIKCAELRSASEINWDTGYDGRKYDDITVSNTDVTKTTTDIQIHSAICSIGRGCAAIGFTTVAHGSSSDSIPFLRLEHVFEEMIDSAISKLNEASGLGTFNILHIRLFYTCNADHDHSLSIRCSFQSALRSFCYFCKRRPHELPATSFVPVQSISISPNRHTISPFAAMQFIVVDMVHLETEMWIHHDRTT